MTPQMPGSPQWGSPTSGSCGPAALPCQARYGGAVPQRLCDALGWPGYFTKQRGTIKGGSVLALKIAGAWDRAGAACKHHAVPTTTPLGLGCPCWLLLKSRNSPCSSQLPQGDKGGCRTACMALGSVLGGLGASLPWGSLWTTLWDQGPCAKCACTAWSAGLPAGPDPGCPERDQQSCRASAAVNIQNA